MAEKLSDVAEHESTVRSSALPDEVKGTIVWFPCLPFRLLICLNLVQLCSSVHTFVHKYRLVDSVPVCLTLLYWFTDFFSQTRIFCEFSLYIINLARGNHIHISGFWPCYRGPRGIRTQANRMANFWPSYFEAIHC